MNMEKVLLHICCGICAGYAIDRLKKDAFQVTGFFYNPNIAGEDEHTKRLEAAQEVATIKNIALLIGEYEPLRFNEGVRGYEDDAEGENRCSICFRMRLEKTWHRAKEGRYERFASTLSISPHKNSAVINAIGTALDAARFLAYDFKLQDGFKKTMDFAKQRSLYRQNYCGCIFSRRK